jgi:hypothetical protein
MQNKTSDKLWYIRAMFAYTTNFGRISEPTSDTNELDDILEAEKLNAD